MNSTDWKKQLSHVNDRCQTVEVLALKPSDYCFTEVERSVGCKTSCRYQITHWSKRQKHQMRTELTNKNQVGPDSKRYTKSENKKCISIVWQDVVETNRSALTFSGEHKDILNVFSLTFEGKKERIQLSSSAISTFTNWKVLRRRLWWYFIKCCTYRGLWCRW